MNRVCAAMETALRSTSSNHDREVAQAIIDQEFGSSPDEPKWVLLLRYLSAVIVQQFHARGSTLSPWLKESRSVTQLPVEKIKILVSAVGKQDALGNAISCFKLF